MKAYTKKELNYYQEENVSISSSLERGVFIKLTTKITNNNSFTIYGEFDTRLFMSVKSGTITSVNDIATITVCLPEEGIKPNESTVISTDYYDDLPDGKYEITYNTGGLYTKESLTTEKSYDTPTTVNTSGYEDKAIVGFFAVVLVAFMVICFWLMFWGLICRAIVRSKGYTIANGYSKNYGFAWGLLGFIGIIVCAVKPAVGEFAKKTVVIQQPVVTQTPPSAQSSVSEQIQEINKLKDEGFITEEEYEAKKKQILGI